MLKKLYNVIAAPIKWNRAYNQAVSGSYQDALQTLRNTYEFMGWIAQPEKALYDFNLLYGWLLSKTEKFGEAIKVLSIAKNQVSHEASLSQYEKEYLSSFCNWNIIYSATQSGVQDILQDKSLNFKFNNANLDKVKLRLRRAFPLPAHN